VTFVTRENDHDLIGFMGFEGEDIGGLFD